MCRKLNRVGEKYTTNEGYIIIIIEYSNNIDCTIQFEDGTQLYKKQYVDISRGNIKHPFHLSVYNTGYLGIGGYNSNTHKKYYSMWHNMIKRCYDEKQQQKQPTYIGCSVDPHWYNFQNFAKWCDDNYIESYVLDKDIICKECKIYSSDTCLFVPSTINSIFVYNTNNKYPTGVFKRCEKFGAQINIKGVVKNLGYFSTVLEASHAFKAAKKQHILNTANEWKEKISEKAYYNIIRHAE